MSYKYHRETGPILLALVSGLMLFAAIYKAVQIYKPGISHWCDCKVAK